MFIIVKDLPKNIIGIKVSGKTSKLDYDAINPIMEIHDDQNRKPKLLVKVEDFNHAASTFFEDLKSSFNYRDDVSAMAIVSDKSWLDKGSDILEKLFPGLSAKGFELKDYENALIWLKQQ